MFQRRVAKFIMVDSYEMDFMKSIVILVKEDEMYNILKSSDHDQSFCLCLPLNVHTFTTPLLYYRAGFIL